jgi:hypothetical protein
MVSRCLSATGVRFSVILFPPRNQALLTVGFPAQTDRTSTGVSAFRTHELRPGRVPSVSRGRRCSPRTGATPRPASAASQRPVPAPHLQPSIWRGHASRDINEGSSNSPVRSSPHPPPPGWKRATASAFPRASHPADQEPDNARQGGDRPTEHVPGTTAQLTSVDLQSDSSLNVCDIASHVAKRASGVASLRMACDRPGRITRSCPRKPGIAL